MQTVCGTTMSLTTDGMPPAQRQLVLKWGKEEAKRRDLSPNDLINYVRSEIRKRVLNDTV